MNGLVPNYSLLSVYREVLTDTDLLEYANYDEETAYRWITSIRRIDWHKYFAKHTMVHGLALQAARTVPNNPIGFLKPEWVNAAIHQYRENCPAWAKSHAGQFRQAANEQNFGEMKAWFEIIENLL